MKKLRPRNLSAKDTLYWHGWEGSGMECWNWSGGKFPQGYGRVQFGGKTWKAHRLAYVVWVGPIPEGVAVRHSCDNTLCMNPHLLSIGTHQDNSNDMKSRGRSARPKGSKHPNARLNELSVRQIRQGYAAGSVTQQELAEAFDVSFRHISDIINRRKWSHVE